MQKQRTRTRIASLDEIDTAKIFRVSLERKEIIFVAVGFFFFLGVLFLHVVNPVYTAQLQVAPVQSISGDTSNKLGGLGSLASMAGVTIPQDQGNTQYRLYLAGIYSRSTADAMSQRTDIMSALFSKEWDEHSRDWREPEKGLLDYLIWGVKSVLGLRVYQWQPPDGARLQEYMVRHVMLDQDPKKPLATISYNNENPKFAVQFLAALHAAIDNQLRVKSLQRSQQYIKYLSARLPTVNLTEQREAIANIMTDQEKTMMMTSAAGAYAAEPFGPPSVGDRPSSPVPAEVLLIFTAIGFAVGVLVAVMQSLGWIGQLQFHRAKSLPNMQQAG